MKVKNNLQDDLPANLFVAAKSKNKNIEKDKNNSKIYKKESKRKAYNTQTEKKISNCDTNNTLLSLLSSKYNINSANITTSTYLASIASLDEKLKNRNNSNSKASNNSDNKATKRSQLLSKSLTFASLEKNLNNTLRQKNSSKVTILKNSGDCSDYSKNILEKSSPFEKLDFLQINQNKKKFKRKIAAKQQRFSDNSLLHSIGLYSTKKLENSQQNLHKTTETLASLIYSKLKQQKVISTFTHSQQTILKGGILKTLLQSETKPINGMIKTYSDSNRTFSRPYSAKTVFFYKDGDEYFTVKF